MDTRDTVTVVATLTFDAEHYEDLVILASELSVRVDVLLNRVLDISVARLQTLLSAQDSQAIAEEGERRRSLQWNPYILAIDHEDVSLDDYEDQDTGC